MLVQCSETSKLKDNKEFFDSMDDHYWVSSLVIKGIVNSGGAQTNPDNSKSGEKNYSIITFGGVAIRLLNLRWAMKHPY